MQYLLDNKFAPVTFAVGFLKADIASCVSAYKKWQHLTLRFTKDMSAGGSLQELLSRLEPLDAEGRTALFASTSSDWTAYFDNSARGAQPETTIGYLAENLRVRGLVLTNIPKTIPTGAKGILKGVWGARGFWFYDAMPNGKYGLVRSVSITNDVDGAYFESYGDLQVFENPEQYQNGETEKRLPLASLIEIAKFLQIEIMEPSFYGPAGHVIFADHPFRRRGAGLSYQEAKDNLKL